MLPLVVDVAARRIHVQDQEIHLTRSEFDILHALGRRAGAPVSKDALARTVGSEPSGSARRGIEVHVANLRRKLGDGRDHPAWIRTVRGRGYLVERGVCEIRG